MRLASRMTKKQIDLLQQEAKYFLNCSEDPGYFFYVDVLALIREYNGLKSKKKRKRKAEK